MSARRRDPLWNLAWPLGWAVLTALPYLAARWTAPEGYRYLWLLPPYAPDSQAYLAWARQAFLGAFVFKLKLTAAPHEPFLVQPFFFLVGRLAAWTGWELGVAQLVLKSAGVVLFWTAFRRLAVRLGFTGTALWSATLLAGFGAGLGGLVLRLIDAPIPHESLPADLWLIDAVTAWSLTWNALFPFSLALILFFFEALDRALTEGGPVWGWRAGAALALLLLTHPYAAPLLALVAALEAARRRRLAALWRAVLPAALPAAYLAWASWANPVIARHGELGRMPTPGWTAVLLAFSPALPLAAWGLLLGGKAFARRHALLLGWAAAALLLSRLPVWFQRKLLFGAQLPLALLAGAAVADLARRDGNPRRTAAGLVAIALALGAPSWEFVIRNTRLSLSLHERNRYYASEGLMAALDFLARRGGPDEVVLCAPDRGGLVAMVAGKAAVWGHWAQSVDAGETGRWLEELLAPGETRGRAARLWEKADWVLADGGLRDEVERGRLRWLGESARPVFSNRDAAVYARPDPSPRGRALP